MEQGTITANGRDWLLDRPCQAGVVLGRVTQYIQLRNSASESGPHAPPTFAATEGASVRTGAPFREQKLNFAKHLHLIRKLAK